MLFRIAVPLVVLMGLASLAAIAIFGSRLGTLTEFRVPTAALIRRPQFLAATGVACQRCHQGVDVGVEASALTSTPAPESIVYEEDFAEGVASLDWKVFPGFSPDRLTPVPRTDAPDGDGWVGRVTNQTYGGFASLSYAGNSSLSDYSIEVWVYTEVSEDQRSPLHGIAIRVDPVAERFYRLVAQFGREPRLTLAYVGKDVNHFPVYLRTWAAAEIPSGIPAASGWHRMKLRAAGENLWAYWDEQELPGGPVTDSRIKNGYFGVYANFVGGMQQVQTLVDAIVVTSDVDAGARD